MNKAIKVLLILGITFLAIGLTVFLVGFGLNDWKLINSYNMETYTASGKNENLDLKMSAGEINVVFYDGETVQVDYPTASPTRGYTVTEEGGTVTVKPLKNFQISLFDLDGIPAVTVKIPRGDSMNFKLSVSAGKATVESGSFKNFTANLSAGQIKTGEISCTNFSVDMSAGSFTSSGVRTAKADIDLSAGAATLSFLTADDISVDLSAGTVNMNIAGRKADYAIAVKKSAGSCNLTDQTGEVAGKRLDVHLSAGTVNVIFSD